MIWVGKKFAYEKKGKEILNASINMFSNGEKRRNVWEKIIDGNYDVILSEN